MRLTAAAAALGSAKGDVMRALDSFFESGGEMPEDAAVPMHDDSDDDGLDEEELSRAEAGAGTCSRPGAPRAWRAAMHAVCVPRGDLARRGTTGAWPDASNEASGAWSAGRA